MSVRKEGLALPFRSDPGMGRGLFSRLGRKASPGGPIRIFLFFLLFCFLISDLFPNLLQKVSIQIKQFPSAIKYSLQCFKLLINMFSK
jgi:hypothetical protein